MKLYKNDTIDNYIISKNLSIGSTDMFIINQK